ncbi:MAG: FAD-dependent oxidoreductase, partial [Candidatus Heimdallarchaeota archaeon]|nr:FAD-dependent oxidoreductase [Candidatus Heimdallarchaeota archaeon]
MSSKIWDLICVGGGPAGLSCAIRTAELGRSVLVLEARSGSATAGSMTVDGYPGFFSITRQELLDKMARQAKYHATIKYAERVSRLELQDDIKKIYTKVSRGEFFTEEVMYQSKTVLIATGLHPKRLGVRGERKFKSKGIYYNNPPEADYEEKNLVVIGHTSWAVRNALHYDASGAHVSLITARNTFDAHPALLRRLNESFVEIRFEHEVISFEGGDKVDKVILKDKNGKKVSVSANIVIVLSSKIKNRELFLNAGLAMTPRGTIIANSADQDTNLQGVFAAGSATRGDSIVGVDAAEGQKAAMQISRYLDDLEKEAAKDKPEKLISTLGQRFVEGRSVIIEKEDLSPEIIKWVVKAPRIAKKTLPGQFVILRVTEHGERIPLTVADMDKEAGTITLIFQKIG